MRTGTSNIALTVLASLVALLAAGPSIAQADDERVHVERRVLVYGDHGLGHHSRAFLGVQLTELSTELRIHFGVPEDVGVMVAKVIADTPAERSGVRVGDIITRVDGEDVASSRQLAHVIRSRGDGDAVSIEIWREGSIEVLAPTLEARPDRTLGSLHRTIRCGAGETCDFGFDCGKRCEIEVRCDGGDCECTANGDSIDCAQLPHHRRHHDDN